MNILNGGFNRKKNDANRLQVPAREETKKGDQKDQYVMMDVNERIQMIQTSMQAELEKIEKLSLINASARFELLNANSQLIDFQMNRFIKHT